jgi:hypothetical protein
MNTGLDMAIKMRYNRIVIKISQYSFSRNTIKMPKRKL